MSLFETHIRPLRTRLHTPQEYRMHFSLVEQMFFVKQLSFLLGAHTPLLESIHILKTQARKKKVVHFFDYIATDITNGLFLSTSLMRHTQVFDPCVIALIRIGEVSGNLSTNLQYLAEELRKKHLLRRKMLGALLYPSLVTFATLGLVSMLTLFIFPKIMPLFIGMKITLPWTTRTVLAFSTFLKHYGILSGVIIACVGYGYRIGYRKIPTVTYRTDRILLAIPLVGTMIRTYQKATFCRTCHTLLASGIMLPDALLVLHETTNNAVYAKAYAHLGKSVRQGKQLSAEMHTLPILFDTPLCHMVAIGEQTGNLSQTFLYLSHAYEAEVDDLTKNISNTIEPILMSIMGAVVGFVALSVITPIYEITQHLNRR